METRRKFRTLVRGVNAYQLGRISGFMTVLCQNENENCYANMGFKNSDDIVLTVKTTVHCYENFKKLVEKNYPGVCEFDYHGNEEG